MGRIEGEKAPALIRHTLRPLEYSTELLYFGWNVWAMQSDPVIPCCWGPCDQSQSRYGCSAQGLAPAAASAAKSRPPGPADPPR